MENTPFVNAGSAAPIVGQSSAAVIPVGLAWRMVLSLFPTPVPQEKVMLLLQMLML